MDSEKVGTREDLIERRQLDFEIARLFGRDKRIVCDDHHSHRTRTRSHDSPDATQPDDAERLALQFNANKFLAIPAPRFETAARLRRKKKKKKKKRHKEQYVVTCVV